MPNKDDNDDNDDYDDNNPTSESEKKTVKETSWPLDRYVSLMDKMTAT